MTNTSNSQPTSNNVPTSTATPASPVPAPFDPNNPPLIPDSDLSW